MKDRGEPAISIWQKILGHWRSPGWQIKVNLHEDNTTAIHGVRTGKNPTMKTLERNFGVKVGYMHEQVCGTGDDGPPSPFTLIHTSSRHMSADIYTKGFTDKTLFSTLKQMINVYSPEQWRTLALSPKPNAEDEASVPSAESNLSLIHI